MVAPGVPSLDVASVYFNTAPIAEIDPSWLDAMAHGALIGQLRDRPAARRWLSRHLLDSFELAGTYWTDFEPPRTRLTLLDRETLQALLLRIGLVLRGDEVRLELDGVRLKNLAARIGEEHLNFTFRAAPLLGRVPPFDYETGFRDPRLRYLMFGAAYALPGKAMAEPAYAMRVALRLPRELHEELLSLADRPSLSPEEEADMPPLAKRILREVAPSWLPLFD